MVLPSRRLSYAWLAVGGIFLHACVCIVPAYIFTSAMMCWKGYGIKKSLGERGDEMKHVFFLCVVLLNGALGIEWTSHTRMDILASPLRKHVIGFVPHNATTPPHPDVEGDDCLSVTVALHRRNKGLLRYLRVPLPDVVPSRVAFVNLTTNPVDITMFANHTVSEVTKWFCT